ncbi:MAG: hypothetical protein HC927_06855, partial [Deltaproteobacteria bacterium]|nr:hypothetical protein [Deltaproteobacteria bacterium]
MPSLRTAPFSSLFALALLACQPVDYGDEPDTGADEAEAEADGDGDTTTTSGGNEPEFNCDPTSSSSCPGEQKCTALNQTGTPTYECVPDDTSKLPFEECVPAPTTGQDGCPTGHTCMPVSSDTPEQGLCLELCKIDGDCEVSLCTPGPARRCGSCAAICDPLASACPPRRCTLGIACGAA